MTDAEALAMPNRRYRIFIKYGNRIVKQQERAMSRR